MSRPTRAPRRRTRPLAPLALLLLLLLAAGACSDDGGEAAPTGPREPDPGLAALDRLAPGVAGLAVEGGGSGPPVLSWSPVEGATAYAVVVGDDDGIAWMWVGAETEVVLGAMPAPVGDDGGEPIPPVDDELALLADLPVGEHRWFVTAVAADDQVLAVSGEATVTVEG